MRKTALLPAFLLLLCGTTKAQENNPTSKWMIESATLHVGTTNFSPTSSPIEYFQKIAPESKLVHENLAGYKVNSRGTNMNATASARMILAPTNWRAENKIFRMTYRFGISANTFTPISIGYRNEETAPYDKYVSAGSGQSISIDSTHYSNYYFAYETKVTTVDFGAQWNTNYDRRWSFYAGVSGSVGFSASHANYSFNESTSFENGDEYSDFNIQRPDVNRNQERENLKASTTFAFGVSAPIGVQFRLAKTCKFLNKARLAFEARPTFIGQKIEGYGMNGSLVQNTSIGFQYDF